ncbi:MAG: hypothetical protein PHH28_10905, partial [Desulfuromonadaceae bacterium]|nr:hypothetical protein [Desulfuromonadaceae bacterium]
MFFSVNSSYAADGGSIKVYYGTTTSYSATSCNFWFFGCLSWTPLSVSADGNGGGTPAVDILGTSYSNESTYSSSSDRSVTIKVKPDATHKIASIRLIQYRTSAYDSVTNVANDDPESEASYTFTLKDGQKYILLVDYDDLVYKLSYTISTDVPASPVTSCNSNANVNISPVAKDPLYIAVAKNSKQTFTINNNDSSCTVDSIDFDNTGFAPINTLDWNAGTKQYTTPAITGNKQFKIRFVGIKYQVTTLVDGTCGSISPATQSYGAGIKQIFTVTLPAGCAVESFKDGSTIKTLSASNTYTIDPISADHTLTLKTVNVSTSSGASYCQVPPFMDGQNVLKPNVLLIFDTSGSMGYVAYRDDGRYTSSYKTTTSYYGYFENNKMYKESSGTYTIDPANPPLNLALGKMSGNYLNYLYMRRVDVLRKIMIGGKVDATAGAARNSATGGTNKRYLITDDGKLIEYGTTDPTGIIHQVADNVRLGLMVFNRNSDSGLNKDGGRIVGEIGTNKDSLVSLIESETSPDGSTPLAESFYEALRYFQGGTSAYNTYDKTNDSSKLIKYNGDVTDSLSPHRVYAKPVQGSCQNNYVILLTDGAPTSDTNIPIDTSYSTWWTSANATTPKPSTLLGKIAYYAHTYDLAANASTWGTAVDPSKLQSINLFTVFSFGDDDGDTYLQEAARFGAFLEDKTVTDTNKNGKPDIATEYIGDSTDPTTTRGYYEANDGSVLQSQLTNIFNSIASSTASGTAAAVANNKSGQRGANMIQALFFPQFPTDNTKKWMGEVQALWYYLDPLINYSAIYQDSTVDGVLNLLNDDLLPSDPFETKSLWKAGAKLQSTDAATRNIYTPINTSSDLTSTDNTFVATKADTLKTAAYMNIAALTDPGGMIDYLRGVHKDIYRNRTVTFTDPSTGTVTTGVWKLGDIVNSTPIVQSAVPINSYDTTYADSSYGIFNKTIAYKGRNVVYTGSNDGMLHAFRLGTSSAINDNDYPFKIAKLNGTDLGKEEWAFIPKNALPYLQHQCGSDYCHQYLVDGSPLVVDASINIPTDCSSAQYWECPTKTTASANYVLDTAKT